MGPSAIGHVPVRPRVAWAQPEALSAPRDAVDFPWRRSCPLSTSTQIPDTKERAGFLPSPPTAEVSSSTIHCGNSSISWEPLPGEDEASADAEAAAEGARVSSPTDECPDLAFEISAAAELKPLVWDAECCSKEITLSDGGRIVTKTGSAKGLHGILGNRADIDSFKVRIRYWSRRGFICIGYARFGKLLDNCETARYDGWFIRCVNGRFYTAFDDAETAYCGVLHTHDIIEVILDRASSRISFLVNGEERVGVEFGSMGCDCAGLFPCTQLGSPNASVELV